MPRLTAPNGATVNVSGEKAERLLGQGYTNADEAPKRRTRKPAADDSK